MKKADMIKEIIERMEPYKVGDYIACRLDHWSFDDIIVDDEPVLKIYKIEKARTGFLASDVGYLITKNIVTNEEIVIAFKYDRTLYRQGAKEERIRSPKLVGPDEIKEILARNKARKEEREKRALQRQLEEARKKQEAIDRENAKRQAAAGVENDADIQKLIKDLQ